MKINIELDLTPEEARSLLGMPNITAIQEAFVGIAKDKLEKTAGLVDLEPMLKTWTGLGGFATDALTGLIGAAVKGAADAGSRASSPAKASESAAEKTK